jgi:enterochelin esterase-like enzyme
MNYVNLPGQTPRNVTHKTFYSKLYGHELGYNIYLPPDYDRNENKYPVTYHLHGWTGSESTEIWTLEKVYSKRQSITVFANSSPVIEDKENLPVELMIIEELIPYIDEKYRTYTACGNRSISGFSMGGGAAFYYAVKHRVVCFCNAYAGTYTIIIIRGLYRRRETPEKSRRTI